MSKVNLLVHIRVKSGQTEQFEKFFRDEFVSRSRTEPGCETYWLWKISDDPHEMVIVERWTARSDFDRHVGQDWFALRAPEMEGYLEAPPQVRFHDEAA